MNRGRVFIMIVLLALNGSVYASGALDKEDWSKLRQKLEFGQPVDKKQQEKKQNSSERKRPGTGPVAEERDEVESRSFPVLKLGARSQVVVIGVFVVLLVVILYRLFNSTLVAGNKTIVNLQTGVETDFSEEPHRRSDLDKWLDQAMENRDYRLAIRIYFLMTLKVLEERQLIDWEKEKTNWHYIQELRQQPFQQAFQELVQVFERTWYGDKFYPEDQLLEKLEAFKTFRGNLQKTA